MPCQNPIIISSPETRFLRKCRRENRSYEYYIHQANQRRNIMFDPTPLVDNPFEYYSSKTDVRRVVVPCGKCDLCLKSRVDSVFIRAYYEWLSCKFLRHGSCWFITLTYADEILPRLSDGTPCFDVEHLQLFLKRLRKRIESPLRYLLVSEFGGEFGRPHYHGLVYVDNMDDSDKNKWRMFEHIALSWTKIEDRNVRFSSMSNIGLFDVQRVSVDKVDSPGLLRYTSKYVGKQIGAIEFDKLDIEPRYKRRTLHSIDFGADYMQFCNKDVWTKGYLEVDGYKYSIPQSFKVKVMREYYCTHENGDYVYRPSDFALQYLSNLSRRQVEEHKALSVLNADYPVPPAFVYDPIMLGRFFDYIDTYMIFREQPLDYQVDAMVNDWNDYLLEVQAYNKSHYDAQALKWKNQQKEHYLKKTGRK